MENDLFILIDMINTGIKSLNEKGISIIDKENLDFKLKPIHYDAKEDEVFFYTEVIKND